MMEITLNHTIVSAHNHIEAAKWWEEIFGFVYVKEWSIFAVLKVNSTLSFDFITKSADEIHSQHYAFKVTEDQFDQIFSRIKEKEIQYCSGPRLLISGDYDSQINTLYGGRVVYFKDLSGHRLEIISAAYYLDE
jgi:catechol 2,3-dioxygenase-like lactoylglutathione lyase family enzyme